MARIVLVILVLIVWCPGPLSAEPIEQGAIRAALQRESARLASMLVAFDRTPGGALGLHTVPTSPERNDDWEALRRLRSGTRVVVATSRVQGIKGTTALVTEDALHLVDRHGVDQMLRREDIGEVHLDHRLSVGQYVGLGLLVGGVAGFAVGQTGDCDCELRGLGTIMGLISGTLGGAVGGWMISGVEHGQPRRLVYRRAKR